MQDSYTINSINNQTGVTNVTLTYTLANGQTFTSTQNISNLPITDVQGLQDSLSDYLVAYKAGKQQEFDEAQANVVPANVQALVGQAQAVIPSPTPTQGTGG